MRKFPVILPWLFLFSACASVGGKPAFPSAGKEEAAPGGLWSTVPAGGKLVIIGAAGRQIKREDAVMLALEDAARKAAFFHGIYGYTETFVQTGSSYYDFDSGKFVEFIYDDEHMNYADRFEFDEKHDVFEEDDSVFVRVRFDGSLGSRVNFRPTAAGSTPDWIRAPPKDIGGYTAGVGFSLRHSYYKDTVIASYEAAAASILNKLHSRAGSVVGSFEAGGYSDALTLEIQIAEGFLTEFYVLETWTDPGDKSVWTLAIAKNGGR
ncbi:MAG: hypothetical protein LBH15_05905 [Treponema sp.]|jgi:hypothetical protein|nr:hypothetical protein [Treponema sp.]